MLNEDTLVKNCKNCTNLQYIKINGLFEKSNITLDFDKEVNIYIGENGLGKTTILNCVYYILKKKYVKLAEINFDNIIVKFSNDNKEYNISSSDVLEYNRRRHHRGFYSENEMLISYLEDSIGNISEEIIDRDNFEMLIRRIAHRFDAPISLVRQYVFEYLKNGKIERKGTKKGDYKKIDELNQAIDDNIGQRVIYLTTYRRIENDLSNLISQNDRLSLPSDRFSDETDILIQFGMSDVDKAIKDMLKKINETSRESFNKMTGVLIKEYALGSSEKGRSKEKIDEEMVKIIFDRMGDEIEETEKNNIYSLVHSNNIYEAKYSYLLDLIIKLIESYEKTKIFDEKIKKFSDACNKYLSGKKFVYNQSALKLNIEETKRKDKTIALSSLSSGEKQIVSLFSKLYLENDKDCILIIDEPELSISMKWQKMLLPDIMRSENCKLLLTVTHSPFIFENEFDMDAKEMRNCISE